MREDFYMEARGTSEFCQILAESVKAAEWIELVFTLHRKVL